MGVQGGSLRIIIEPFRFEMLSGCGEISVLQCLSKHKALSSVLRNIWILFPTLVIQMLGRQRQVDLWVLLTTQSRQLGESPGQPENLSQTNKKQNQNV